MQRTFTRRTVLNQARAATARRSDRVAALAVIVVRVVLLAGVVVLAVAVSSD